MFEQHTLYADNFHGFQDAYIPIADVNFLVGENSSGKTSLLSLLKLMSVDRFLLDNQFTADDVDIGTFDDIVSAHATNPDYFRIGMMRKEVSKKALPPLGMLVTYEKHEGLPRDTRFTCSYGSQEIAVMRSGKEFYYRLTEEVVTPQTDIKRLFAKWIEDHENPGGDFKKLDFPFDPDEHPLLFPLSFIALHGNDAEKRGARLPLLTPTVFPSTVWVAPIRTKPRRTYDELRRGFSSEGIHTPYLIRKILDSASEAKRFQKTIRDIGKGSGLFQSVEIKKFGDDITAPFEVRIVLDDKSFNLTNVGYGVSQCLPVLVEILWRTPGSWFAIQQPEVHLHPRAQAALGDLIFRMASSEKKRFLVETHSDFMIDRFRVNLRKERGKKPESQVLFFERRNQQNTVFPLVMSSEGEMPTKQPKSYRDFFLKETFRMLDL